jgi:hypothetical protein
VLMVLGPGDGRGSAGRPSANASRSWPWQAVFTAGGRAESSPRRLLRPEWNYRRSQGPWGRAIAQWVPPQLPIYTIHTWPTDLAFAIGRPIRQLPDPKALAFQQADHPQLVLLLDSDSSTGPRTAPSSGQGRPIPGRASAEDRVLARTEGDFLWRGWPESLGTNNRLWEGVSRRSHQETHDL